MKPVIVVTHAVFDEARRASMARLRAQLDAEADGIPVLVAEDLLREGSLSCWRHAMRAGLATDATHVVWLPDDAILCRGFGKALRKAIAAQPDQVFDCVVNHGLVHDAEANPDTPEQKKLRLADGWYTTTEGYCGGAGVMPRALLEEHLAWRDRTVGWAPKGDAAYCGNDYGVNVWAMATGRLIFKTARSLIDHDISLPSLDGNDAHDFRRPLNRIEDATDLEGWDKPPIALSRTYRGTHWTPIYNESLWGDWDPERSYRVERHGQDISSGPHVYIVMPGYRGPELAVRKSLARVIDDLKAHGIEVTQVETPGDSLVTRARHCSMHDFLCSRATHLLQWDDDVECLDATAVRKMLRSGHDIVGGAYPWRDGSGRVVCNPIPADVDARTGAGAVQIDQHNCIRVAEVGTGFLMTSRTVLLALMRRHPELMYQADLVDYAGVPMWALFDVALEEREGGRKRYASEDWRFCSLAREAGYPVHIYYPPIFRHWGKHPHGGHVTSAWGMNVKKEAAA